MREVNPSEALRRLNVFALRAPTLPRPLAPAEADEARALLRSASRASPDDIGDIMLELRRREVRGRPDEAAALAALDALSPADKRAIGRFKIRSVLSEARVHLSTPRAWFALRDGGAAAGGRK